MAYRVSSTSASKRFKVDTSKKITSFFNITTNSNNQIDSPFKKITGQWEDFKDHLVFTPNDDERSYTKVAAFDMDGTLIKPKSGKKFAENPSDWMILYKNIPKILLDYYNQSYKLVIFSNQSPLGSDTSKRGEFKQKIEDILNEIKLPMHVFLATQKNLMRKPCTGMWEAMTERNTQEIDKSECFYVGDAAGRPKRGNIPKDHSFADLFFAKNLKIKFYTPEEIFQNTKCTNTDVKILYEPKITCKQTNFALSQKPEVILMVGSPASGKSSFCKQNLLPSGYIHVNRDNLGSWQKCIQLVRDSLKNNKRVVVDNTNKDKESRLRFIEVAKSFKVPCRCFHMKVEKSRAMHNNKFRELTKEEHVNVTDIIIHSFYKGFQEPSVEEGFDEIVELKCVPEFGDNEYKNKELYEMYLLEKP